MSRLFASAFVWITLAAALPAEGDFVPLFDGQSLAGWHGGAYWSVQDGAIVGKCDGKIPDNTFLICETPVENFVLKIKFKLHGHKGNSGVQFRSEERQGEPPFVVAGYQADIASDKHMGILYGEKTGRGIIVNLTPELQATVAAAIHQDDWNEYVITANGHHITQVLNGVTTVDVEDPEGATKGIIALQLHKGHDMQISFKDILLQKLP